MTSLIGDYTILEARIRWLEMAVQMQAFAEFQCWSPDPNQGYGTATKVGCRRRYLSKIGQAGKDPGDVRLSTQNSVQSGIGIFEPLRQESVVRKGGRGRQRIWDHTEPGL